jgi:UDP-2-acetamido-2,6-beta-L-arabino-hexul-4-ose reductase
LLCLLPPASWDPSTLFGDISPTFTIALGELRDLIVSFRDARSSAILPDLSKRHVKCLYTTYLSFCDPNGLSRPVDLKRDARGWLFEWIKSTAGGQVFVSTTRPGVTRGNHYHDTKVEKFCVVKGQGLIRLRSVLGDEVLEFSVGDSNPRVVDIPPGYAHSIENTGTSDMVTLFWANEIFDAQRPDTFAENAVHHPRKPSQP